MSEEREQAKSMAEVYRQWILAQPIPEAKVEVRDGNIRIETDYAVAEVNFYDLEVLVIELRITARKDDETAFFLHFELRELSYAKELFEEMRETLLDLGSRQSVQVLLSCTSALTTGLMADRLNEASGLAEADYHFEAVPYAELYGRASDYDLILLAPQIAYEGKRIRSVFKDKTILDIPPRMFATYDAPAILELVRGEYENRKKHAAPKAEKKTIEVTRKDMSILVLVFLHQGRGMAQILCRHYKGGEVLREVTHVRRPRNFVTEVCDVLDTTQGLGENYDAIGITMPGEIWEGRVHLNMWKLNEVDIREVIEKRYHVPVVLQNNAQAGALGFWLRHKHYKNAVLLTQSQGARFGGAGIIANGRLLEGSHRIAGEIKYILRRFYGLTIRETHSVSMEEMLETTDLYARCLISIIDPEIILVRNMMIPDIEMLRESLLKTIPGRILPKLRKISDSDALEYMLLGIMARCMEEA